MTAPRKQKSATQITSDWTELNAGLGVERVKGHGGASDDVRERGDVKARVRGLGLGAAASGPVMSACEQVAFLVAELRRRD